MKSPLSLLLICLFCGINSFGQQVSNLHIVTSPDNRMGSFHFNFTVNGIHYKLKAGECLELKLQADSIHIIMEDRRWVNKEPVDLHVPAGEQVYVQVLWGWVQGEKKRIKAIAQAICETCFAEFKQKCRRELTE